LQAHLRRARWALPHFWFVFTTILTVAPEVDFYSTTLLASHQLISGIQSGYHVKNLLDKQQLLTVNGLFLLLLMLVLCVYCVQHGKEICYVD